MTTKSMNFLQEQKEVSSPSDELDTTIRAVLSATADLKVELQNTSLEQVSLFIPLIKT